MTPNTLIDCMGYTDRELRRAAALAAGSKKGTDRLVPLCKALIGRVGDDEAFVAQAARTSLKALSNKTSAQNKGQCGGPHQGGARLAKVAGESKVARNIASPVHQRGTLMFAFFGLGTQEIMLLAILGVGVGARSAQSCSR